MEREKIRFLYAAENPVLILIFFYNRICTHLFMRDILAKCGAAQQSY